MNIQYSSSKTTLNFNFLEALTVQFFLGVQDRSSLPVVESSRTVGRRKLSAFAGNEKKTIEVKRNIPKTISKRSTTKKHYEKKCHCNELITPSEENVIHLEKLDEIDPISNMTVRETIYKRHPNLGPQIFSTGPRCDFIPHVTM